MNPAVVTAIKAQAAGFTNAPMYWPNEIFVPPEPPSEFVWAEITGLSSKIRSMGSPGAHSLQDDGFIRFHVAVPLNSGMDTAYSLAETLAALFRITTPNGLTGLQTLAPTPVEAGPASDDGNWYVLSFSVPFYYTYQG